MSSLVCTTFEFRAIQLKLPAWMEIKLELTTLTEDSEHIIYSITCHERGLIPFTAYSKNVQISVKQNVEYDVYVSKIVTQRLNTHRNKCFNTLDAQKIGLSLRETVINQSNTSEYIFLDELDRIRLAKETPFFRKNTTSDFRKDKIMSVIGNYYIYSRELCGWELCSRKQYSMKCVPLLEKLNHLLSDKGCDEKADVDICGLVDFDNCPITCSVSQFDKKAERVKDKDKDSRLSVSS
ncbi:hypothetical protein Ciccas_012012, partial [Cichlidogyrus casuarinus]